MPTERRAALVLAAALFAAGVGCIGTAHADQASTDLAHRLAKEGRRLHDPYLLVAAGDILAQERPLKDETSLKAYLDDATAFSFDDPRIAAEIEKIRTGETK